MTSPTFAVFHKQFPNAINLHSLDLHYALAPTEKVEDPKFEKFSKQLSDYIATLPNVAQTESDFCRGVFERSPWSTPQMGWDIVPISKASKPQFLEEVVKLADFAKRHYEELKLEGTLLFHPNTKEKDTDYLEESLDHLQRAWTFAGEKHRFKNVWKVLIELSNYAKENPDNHDYAQMLAYLQTHRSENLSRLIIKNFNPQLHATG